MANKNRKTIMGLTGLAAVIGYQIYQNRHVRSRVLEVYYEHLPEELDNYRIVQISDLHGAVYGRNNARLNRMITRLEPDVLCITGDMVHFKEDTGQAFLDIIRGLDPELTKLYVSGNHENARRRNGGYEVLDRSEIYRRLKGAGVVLLDGMTFQPDHLPISFSGLFDDFEHYTGIDYNEDDFCPGDHLPMPDRSRFNVALVHRPNYFRSISDYGYQLMLSGHIHGGVIRLGRHHGLLSPEMKFFPELDKGLYRRNESYLHVSSGLGMGKPLPRVANPPEVILLILRKGISDIRKIPEVSDRKQQ